MCRSHGSLTVDGGAARQEGPDPGCYLLRVSRQSGVTRWVQMKLCLRHISEICVGGRRVKDRVKKRERELLVDGGSAQHCAVGGGVGVLPEFGDAVVNHGPDVQVGQVEDAAAAGGGAAVAAEDGDGGAEFGDFAVG